MKGVRFHFKVNSLIDATTRSGGAFHVDASVRIEKPTPRKVRGFILKFSWSDLLTEEGGQNSDFGV